MSVVGRRVLAGVAVLGVSLLFCAPVFAGGPAVSPPTVNSESATGVTPFDAVLEARVTTGNEATSWFFEYASAEALLGTVHATVVGGGTLPGNLEEQTAGPVDIGGGLAASTTYYYRVVASNASGTTKGPVESFTTSSTEKPLVEGESASAVTQTTASLTGAVNPVFQEVTKCEFQYATEEAALTGTPPSVSCAPTASELGQGNGPVPVGASLAGLLPNTTYYYRLLAANGTGTTEGTPEHFLTLPSAPVVVTGEASSVTPESAVIAGTVNPENSGHASQDDTTYWFQYSRDTSYSQRTPLSAADVGEGESPVPEKAELTGLEPGTTYHYRIVASNNNEEGGVPQVVDGEGGEFQTPAPLAVIGPVEVAEVQQGSASLALAIDGEGTPTHWELQLGTTPGDLEFQATGHTTSSAMEPFAVSLESLTPGTVYYYKVIAVDPGGTSETPEGSFTTPSAPPHSTTTQTSTLLLTPPNITIPGEIPPGEIRQIELTNAQKLAKALKTCRKERPKSKRAACEKHAHRQYPTKPKTKKKQTTKKKH